MVNIRVCEGAYFLTSPDTEGIYSDCFGAESEVSDNEKTEYAQQLENTVNEKIADELIMTVKKIAVQNGGTQAFQEYETGISFGSAYGCIDQARRSRESIAQKAEKGIRPKEAVNNIPCGAASKAAILLELKAFNLTNFDCCNAGVDAVIFACETLSEGRASCAFAVGGDAELSFAGVLLKLDDDCKDGFFITGYSKGLVYGNDVQEQISYLIGSAISSCKVGNFDRIFIVDSNGDTAFDHMKLPKLRNAEITELSFDENAISSKGVFAIGYAKRYMKTGSSALIIQLGREGHFSCIALNKT